MVRYIYEDKKYEQRFRDIQKQANREKIGIWEYEGYADEKRGFNMEVLMIRAT